jgi:hypothetical protein
MAALNEASRVRLWKRAMQFWSDRREPVGAVKVEVRQLIDDLDDYVDANASAMNQAIRPGIRGKFTTEQKAYALALVALLRAGEGIGD